MVASVENRVWWKPKTRRLLSYIIGGDRDWEELYRFAKWSGWTVEFVRQAVAWLELSKEVGYDFGTKKWTTKVFTTAPVEEEVFTETTCPCGVVFRATKKDLRFCSDLCRAELGKARSRHYARKKRKVFIACQKCGKKTGATSSRRKFCDECGREARFINIRKKRK